MRHGEQYYCCKKTHGQILRCRVRDGAGVIGKGGVDFIFCLCVVLCGIVRFPCGVGCCVILLT